MPLHVWLLPLLFALAEDDLRGLEIGLDESPSLSAPAASSPDRPPDDSSRFRTIADGINACGIKAFQAAATAAPQGNLILSPYALALTLDLAAHAAEGGDTAQSRAIRARMGQENLDPRLIDRFHAATLAQLLDSSRGLYVRFSQSRWGGKPLDSAFRAGPGKTYRLQTVDPGTGGSAESGRRMAAWAYRASGTWIPSLGADPAPGGEWAHILVLHGYWGQERSTEPGLFPGEDGRTRYVDVLRFSEPYAEADSLRILRLPFAEGRHSLVIILPDSSRRMQDVIARLSPQEWRGWMGIRPLLRGSGTFPILALGTTGSLPAGLPGSGLRQGVYAKIGARGYKYYPRSVLLALTAARASAWHPGPLMLGPPALASETFHVDRPFLFAIRDNRTGLLLLIGRVSDPAPHPNGLGD